MNAIKQFAPAGNEVVEYDRQHLALYAALLDADAASQAWQEVAAVVMQIDVADSDAEACWRSHLDRAQWIVGKGLGAAVEAFAKRPCTDTLQS